MYELSRVRLHSVGPKGARYRDVLLDLRDVGQPVAHPGVSAARRPSPATVLFLENGGGKTVLMRLIFSVMLPGRRNVLGTSSSRGLEDYVLAGDVAHVILEWQHTRTGQRVVTAKASEWRGHTVSTDSNRLTELWYTFRPTAAFNVDTLPLTVDGRLVTLSGFRDRLSQAARAEPKLQAASETSHRDWVAKLDDLGLDPELFRYQRAMNAGEGEAAEAFTFKSDQAFVEFLLRAVTDEEDTRGIADVMTGYAGTLSRRGALMAERDFVAGALERISPLGAVTRDAAAATELARGARRDAEQLAAMISVRHRTDAAILTRVEAEAAEIQKTENAADREVDRLGAIALELRRLVVGMQLRESQEAQEDLERRKSRTQRLLKAWQATELALALHQAQAQVDALRRLVEEQVEKARPALQARDSAASALKRGLRATAQLAETEAATAETEAARLDAEAQAADKAAEEAVIRREQAGNRLGNAEKDTNRVQGEMQNAVDEGILDEPGRIAAAAADAAEEADRLRDEKDEAWQELEELGRVRTRADIVHTEERDRHVACNAEARSLADRLEKALAASSSLAAEPRLAEVLGTETVDLETDADTLLERLEAAITAAETERATLHLTQARDARAIEALDTGGLLPASPPVEEALSLLQRHNITAWAGWRFLAEFPAEEREQMLVLHPHLADGIVLNNPTHLDQARELLIEARLLPTTIVAVGTTADMQNRDMPAPAGVAFILPPNPALYDTATANRQRLLLLEEQTVRLRRLSELGTLKNEDEQAASRIRTWRTEYPPGTLARFAEESQAAQQHADLAQAEATKAKAELDAAAEAEKRHQRLLPELEKAATRSRQRADRLAALAIQAEQLPAWAEQIRVARQEMADSGQEHTRMQRLAVQRREQATAQREVASAKRHIRSASLEEMSRVIGGDKTQDLDGVPDQSLPELKARYEAATEAYRKVEVGQDLLTDLRLAQERHSQTEARWETEPPDVRSQTLELLQGSDGADAAARTAATRRAEQDLQSLDKQIVAAAAIVAGYQTQLDSLTPQDRSLEPYGKPRDIAHGTELIAMVTGDLAKARNTFDSISAARKALDSRVAQVQDTVREFSALKESLAALTPPAVDEDHAAFTGTVAEARTKRNDVVAALAEADDLMAESDRKVRAAADSLAQFASDPALEAVSSPVRKQIVSVNREDLPRYAADWETALKPRLRTLDDELVQLNEHRAGIVTRLHGMVDAALGVLHSAQRLSKLPADKLGDWSGQEFLRIRFAEVDPAALKERLGQVIDEEVTEPSPHKPKAKDGMSLLLRGVQAAMPKGVAVEMLKPDSVLRNERVRVSSISDVFSGGQLLTAAIILYCTMAALRANDRGHTHRPHAGVLFLDNPIGRASAGYLLELQIAVADALGVQLVYTTGLFDTNALAAFPLIVRLRNDADLRAGLKYLSVDSEIRRHLDTLEASDDTGRLTATRVFVQPRPAS